MTTWGSKNYLLCCLGVGDFKSFITVGCGLIFSQS